MKDLHRVVIVGGGFGGLYAARSFRGEPVQVTLLDRHNYHLFQPLLYQVATGYLSPANVASPLRAELKRHKNVRVLLAEVTGIDVAGRQVITPEESIAYDTLILAAGASHAYFGHPEWEELAPGLKSVDNALEVRSRIFRAFEMAEREQEPLQRKTWLTFVVVGGGPTGVEVAGALGETVLHTIPGDFRSIRPSEVSILLLEGGQRILPAYVPELSGQAMQELEKLGVSVRVGHLVTGVSSGSVSVRQGQHSETIAARTILWAAGVQASPLGRMVDEQVHSGVDRTGRLLVESDLTLAGHPEIIVIGDLANFSHQTGSPLPGLAQPAMQEGAYAARLVRSRLEGRTLPPFHYRDKGILATIGRTSAVADLGRIKLSGFLAKLIWIFVHLWYITEFENRALVFLQWAWNFLTLDQHARIITGDTSVSEPQPEHLREQ